jgi:hypothetical protein
MDYRVRRQPPGPTALRGTLYRDGIYFCHTLENAAKAIPAGAYRVTLTTSGRAQRGELWTPRQDHALPEILEVPDRTAIRVHALNAPEQSEGCVGVGFTQTERGIGSSRAALTQLLAEWRDGPMTIEDAPPEGVLA